MFNRHKRPKPTGAHRAAAARHEQLRGFLDDARSFEGVDAADVSDMRLRTDDGERVFLCIRGALLVELPTRAASAPTPIDQGEFVVTTARAVFTGTKQIRQWLWSNLERVEHSPGGPWTSIEVSNRRRTFGVLYDDRHLEQIRFAVDLAVAAAQGTRDELVGRLSDALAAADAPDPARAEKASVGG